MLAQQCEHKNKTKNNGCCLLISYNRIIIPLLNALLWKADEIRRHWCCTMKFLSSWAIITFITIVCTGLQSWANNLELDRKVEAKITLAWYKQVRLRAPVAIVTDALRKSRISFDFLGQIWIILFSPLVIGKDSFLLAHQTMPLFWALGLKSWTNVFLVCTHQLVESRGMMTHLTNRVFPLFDRPLIAHWQKSLSL